MALADIPSLLVASLMFIMHPPPYRMSINYDVTARLSVYFILRKGSIPSGILVKAEAMLQYIEQKNLNSGVNEQCLPIPKFLNVLNSLNFPDVVTHSVVDYSTKG